MLIFEFLLTAINPGFSNNVLSPEPHMRRPSLGGGCCQRDTPEGESASNAVRWAEEGQEDRGDTSPVFPQLDLCFPYCGRYGVLLHSLGTLQVRKSSTAVLGTRFDVEDSKLHRSQICLFQ